MQYAAKLTLALGAIIYCLENTLGTLANNDLNPIHLSWTRRLVSLWRPKAPLRHTIKSRAGIYQCGEAVGQQAPPHVLLHSSSTHSWRRRWREEKADAQRLCVQPENARTSLDPANIPWYLRHTASHPSHRPMTWGSSGPFLRHPKSTQTPPRPPCWLQHAPSKTASFLERRNLCSPLLLASVDDNLPSSSRFPTWQPSQRIPGTL